MPTASSATSAPGGPVRVIELAHRTAAGALGALPDGAAAAVDGLVLAEFDRLIAAELPRLRLVAFIHHPLAQETGLAPAAAQRIAAIEGSLLPSFRGILCPSRPTALAVSHYGVLPDRMPIAPPGTPHPKRGF